MWTILAMLALVVTGGFISYFGDLQGRRWGKKRVSWFGMRPKHTAILITSLTGAVIALLSVVAVLIAAPNVRAVVLRGERAINENRQLSEEKIRIQKQVNAQEVELKTNSAKMATDLQTLQDTRKQIAQANAENSALKGTTRDLQKTNGDLINGNMELQRKQAALTRSIDASTHQLAVQKKEIANASIINSDLARQNTDYSRKNDELAREKTKLQDTNASLKTDNEKLTAANFNATKSYENASRTYIQALDDYSAQELKKKDLEEKIQNLSGRYAVMKTQLEDLTQQRDELSMQLAGTSRDFLREYISLRQTRYNLRANTELARRTLDAHLSPRAAREEIMALLKDASDRAKRYGAVPGENGRAVVIVSKQVVTPASVQMTDENASVNALVDAIAGSSTPVVVVARTINNTAANEQVLMEITPYMSTKVFDPGAVVASRTIDARQPLDKLIESVILFLKADVRAAAIKAGTIPQISPDTGELEVGAIDTPELVTLLDRIRRTGGPVQVTAVANEPITSADLLTFGQMKGGDKPHNLRFDLKRAASKESQTPRPTEPATR